MIVNQSMVDRGPQRDDIKVWFVACNTIAEELGSGRLLNMVALGALVRAFPLIGVDDLKKALTAHMPSRHRDMIELNFEALARGYSAGEAQ